MIYSYKNCTHPDAVSVYLSVSMSGWLSVFLSVSLSLCVSVFVSLCDSYLCFIFHVLLKSEGNVGGKDGDKKWAGKWQCTLPIYFSPYQGQTQF